MLDRVNIQKASLPQPIASDPAQVFVDARPNAILLEKSGKVEMDFISAQQSTWESIADPSIPTMVVTTGSSMQDTFGNDFLARAYPFIFKTAVCLPDINLEKSTRKNHGGDPLDS